MKRNKFLIQLINFFPNKPLVVAKILKKHYQCSLNTLLTNSMETFNYIGFKTALLLGANPNIDAQTKKGYHLVTRCARSGEDSFLKTLIEFGGDVHGNEAKGGYMPLHMAATKGMASAIEVLVHHGAHIHALYYLKEHHSYEPIGWTPLICACLHNKTQAAKMLLDLGANPSDTNEHGENALQICIKNKNDELIEHINRK